MKHVLPFLLLAACWRRDDWDPYIAYTERTRGLELLEEVEHEVVTPAKLLVGAGALSNERAAELQSTLGRLGFFAPTDDLVALDAEQFGTNIGGYYKDGRIQVVEGSSWSLVVHEVVHALQDQHFAAFARELSTTDAVLAHAALFEGDAQLVQIAFEKTPLDVDVDRAGLIDTSSAERYARDALGKWTGPDWFVRRSAFVYGFGARYAAEVYAREGGNEGLDRRLRDAPPATTQEVLRAGLELDAVEPVGTAWSDATEVDSLGEWMCRILLGRAIPDADAETLAHGWDGDELARFADGGLVWTSIWDDEVIADRVRATLEEIHAGDAMLVRSRDRRVVVASSAERAEAALGPSAAE